MTAFLPGRMRAALVLILALGLAGCATNKAFEEGKQALISGDQERALGLFEQASKESPDNPEIRATFFRQREVAVARLLSQADSARMAGRRDEANAVIDRVLALDPRNQRAVFLREQMTRGLRHDVMVREAGVLLERKDLGGADARLRNILEQDTTHAGAREMLRKVEEARPKQVAPAALGGLFQKTVTLEFRETSMRNVFEAIARSTGINFVFDKDVRADLKVTLFVRNTTVAEVMRLILITNQLERSVLSDNTVLIYPNTAAKQREYKELVTRTFFLVNAEAKQVQNLIKTVVKTKDIYIDERINLIVMKDTIDAVRLAEQLVESVDVAEPEVMLEVEVLEVSSNKMKELGWIFRTRSVRHPAQSAAGHQQPTGARARSPPCRQRIAPGVVPLKDISDLTGYIANPGTDPQSQEAGRRGQSARQPAHPRQEQGKGQGAHRREAAGVHDDIDRQRRRVGVGHLPGCRPEARRRAADSPRGRRRHQDDAGGVEHREGGDRAAKFARLPDRHAFDGHLAAPEGRRDADSCRPHFGRRAHQRVAPARSGGSAHRRQAVLERTRQQQQDRNRAAHHPAHRAQPDAAGAYFAGAGGRYRSIGRQCIAVAALAGERSGRAHVEFGGPAPARRRRKPEWPPR
jgi:tetratricopeptide (TPR) repeat protein